MPRPGRGSLIMYVVIDQGDWVYSCSVRRLGGEEDMILVYAYVKGMIIHFVLMVRRNGGEDKEREM